MLAATIVDDPTTVGLDLGEDVSVVNMSSVFGVVGHHLERPRVGSVRTRARRQSRDAGQRNRSTTANSGSFCLMLFLSDGRRIGPRAHRPHRADA
jgi:hypothetical protein